MTKWVLMACIFSGGLLVRGIYWSAFLESWHTIRCGSLNSGGMDTCQATHFGFLLWNVSLSDCAPQKDCFNSASDLLPMFHKQFEVY